MFFSHENNLNLQTYIYNIAFCTFISSIIDIDHFFVAKSFYLKDLTNLKQRGIFHCTSFWLLLITILLLYSYSQKKLNIYILSFMLILAFTSHHIRDGNRRGLCVVCRVALEIFDIIYVAIRMITRVDFRKINMFLLLCFLFVTVAGQRVGDECIHPYANTLGRCTPVAQCETARTDYQLSGIRTTYCSYSAFGNSLVCCRDGTTILQEPTPIRNENRPVWGSSNGQQRKRVSERKCEEYSRGVVLKVEYMALIPDAEALSVSAAKCDYNTIELIIGGENAEPGEFPHMAAIGWVGFNDEYLFSCGGSLISHKFVLTAGHCIRNKNAKNEIPVIVRLGDQNIDNSVNDGANPVDVPIRNIHTNPNYKPPVKYNDIALLELASDVTFSSTIRAACLWTKPNFPGYDKVVATGWGVTDANGREPSKELKKVALNLFENSHCDSLLDWLKNRNWDGFRSSQMCAGELRGGKDTCQGDSGSPLQVASKDNQCIFHVVGITSFGKQCAKSDSPGVYTRVSSYLDWIEGIVWPGE
ncbi:unnamed protein product [Arctia plantaginis]|uniref:trypsin n=1 Tax=Arctia plantaginis TaxID=874455 RepID=A0A8S1AJN3_ARCPL|nr:unnamed protein product [Arctia plantaginis]